MKNLYAIVFIMWLTSCTVNVSSEAETDLLNQTIEEFNLAFEKVDIEKLNQLTTDQYMHINGNNPAISKDAWMAYLVKRKGQLERGELVIYQYQFNEKKLVVYDRSAFVTGIIEVDGSLRNEKFSRKIRVSHFWIKENNQWKRAGFHDVRIE